MAEVSSCLVFASDPTHVATAGITASGPEDMEQAITASLGRCDVGSAESTMATVRGSGLGRMVVRSAHRIWARQEPIPVSARGPALQAANSNGIPDWLVRGEVHPLYGPRSREVRTGGPRDTIS